MSEAVLSAQNLTAGYNTGSESIYLFSNLSLSLYPGQLVCFMGPNGIGKSTLLRILGGLQKPLKGTVAGLNEKKVAMVLTDKVSALHMNVMDLVSFGRYPYLSWNIHMGSEDMRVVNEAIRKVGLGHLVDHQLYQLSDGQLQMAMIARALAQDTPALLLDEPTSHLDLNNRVEIMNLLRQLARDNNKAILIATHELDLALQTADLIWLADTQKSIRQGIPEDLVLSGAFDEVFQFKGFDLKTGKVQHKPFRKKEIQVVGEGATLLWTLNALERNGYTVTHTSLVKIEIVATHAQPSWELVSPEGTATFQSLGALLQNLAS